MKFFTYSRYFIPYESKQHLNCIEYFVTQDRKTYSTLNGCDFLCALLLSLELGDISNPTPDPFILTMSLMFDPTLTFKISIVVFRVCIIFVMGLANMGWS